MSTKSSTPKLPLDEKLQKFMRRIDSFSYEETSPTFSTSSSVTDVSEKTTEESAKIQENVQATIVEEPIGVEEEQVSQQGKDGQVLQQQEEEQGPIQELPTTQSAHEQEFPTAELRYGRTYSRQRTESNQRCVELHSSPSISDNNNINNKNKNKYKKHKMEVINQLLYNTIPLFSGENTPTINEDVSLLITCSKLAYESLSNAEEQALFLKLLPTRLRGRALELARGNNFTTLEQFIKFIKDNFADTKSYITLTNELRSVQQVPGESLLLYLNRVKRLLEQCKQKAKDHFSKDTSAIEQELEELAVNSYKVGIFNPNLKYFLLQETETTLVSLTSKVRRLEETEQYMLGSNFNHRTYPTNNYGNFSTNINSPSPSFNQFHSNNLPSTSRNVNFNNARSNFVDYKKNNKLKCGFCSRLGHTYYECRTRKSTPFCTFCKSYGHNNTTCPNNSSVNNNRTTRNGVAVNKTFRNYRQVNLAGVDQIDGELYEQCDFCLRKGHNANRCFAKESWEKKQLEEKLNKLMSENMTGNAADAPVFP